MAVKPKTESGEPTRAYADRCPHSRSFTAEFADNPPCPAYQSATFTVADTAHRPLGSGRTCRHLTVGNGDRDRGRFYPRCGLGGSRQRLRWVARMTPGRLAVMRSIEQEFDEATRADRAALLEAKAGLLDGRAADGAAMDSLEMHLSVFLDGVDRFISERGERLADLGLRASQLRQLVADWSLAWLRGGQLFGPTVDAVVAGRFSADAAAFLGAGACDGVPAAEKSAEVVAEAGPLVVERTVDGAQLRLRGEIDVSNSDAIATAVGSALAAGDDIVVDFSEVMFCDLSGLRALVGAAARAAEGQRVAVTGLPEHLQRAVRVVGWANLPNLVIAGAADSHSDPPARP